MLNYWYNKPWHLENIEIFKQIVKMYPNYKTSHANYAGAPWHIKMVSPTGEVVHAYPHLLKAHREGEKAVTGFSEITRILNEAEFDNPDMDVLEDL